MLQLTDRKVRFIRVQLQSLRNVWHGMWMLVADGRWMFAFELKFYPTEPGTLHEDLTRYVLFSRTTNTWECHEVNINSCFEVLMVGEFSNASQNLLTPSFLNYVIGRLQCFWIYWSPWPVAKVTLHNRFRWCVIRTWFDSKFFFRLGSKTRNLIMKSWHTSHFFTLTKLKWEF